LITVKIFIKIDQYLEKLQRDKLPLPVNGPDFMEQGEVSMKTTSVFCGLG